MTSHHRNRFPASSLVLVAWAWLIGNAFAAQGEPPSTAALGPFAADTPASRDTLFGDPPARGSPPRSAPSRDALFDDESRTPFATRDNTSGWGGFVRGELAYTYADPPHWSKMLVRSELSAHGSLFPNVKYKVSARLDYDFAYDATDFYPRDVRRDQRVNLFLRENFLDIGAGDWDFRLGRQHIVWGEMVGLFFADVVSAKDLREFILADFDILRIPQWAARAEYTKGDFHAEAIWIPAASYDEIGKPGAEFFPAVIPPPQGFATLFDNEQIPKRRVSNSNYGLRLSYLANGWDASAFYYRSMDASPTFYRQIVIAPDPAYVYQARHDRITQVGGTLAKDLGATVFKAEAVYTRNRGYGVIDPFDEDGVVKQNTLDVAVGLDFALPADTRFNFQLFDRMFFNHDSRNIYERHEPGVTLLFNRKVTERVEAEILWLSSLQRSDGLVRPRVAWDFQRNWRLVFGVDVFYGPELGFFGQYDNRDRVYTELRYTF